MSLRNLGLKERVTWHVCLQGAECPRKIQVEEENREGSQRWEASHRALPPLRSPWARSEQGKRDCACAQRMRPLVCRPWRRAHPTLRLSIFRCPPSACLQNACPVSVLRYLRINLSILKLK